MRNVLTVLGQTHTETAKLLLWLKGVLKPDGSTTYWLDVRVRLMYARLNTGALTAVACKLLGP